jgi:hypothetical protein
MTPQSSFLYAAAVIPERVEALRKLLKSMNHAPGVVNLSNRFLPFAEFDTLHSARLLIVSDLASADCAVFHLPTQGLPDYLVLMGEVDGSETDFRTKLVRHADSGLRVLFSHCKDFHEDEDLDSFLVHCRVKPAAEYVNWTGRTLLQEREEEALRRALSVFVQQHQDSLCAMPPEQLWTAMRQFAKDQIAAGALTLTAQEPTPLGWRIRNFLHLLYVPLALLVLSPLLLLILPVYLLLLRNWETKDPEVDPPLDPTHAVQLETMENTDTANQFSVFGSLKPGAARLWSMRFFLWITSYAARHIFNRGRLARVSTIHFARWVPFDGGKRMLFSSVYDGSLESYMDDFINKVGYGLNITFSNGIGYPRTHWLVGDGCRDEQTFKRVLRRHQLATEVWYNALPGITAANKQRNSMIRAGVDAHSMSAEQIRQWASLL